MFRISIFVFCFCISCTSIPDRKLSQFYLELSYEVMDDSLKIAFSNPLHCPLRMNASAKQEKVQAILTQYFPLTLSPRTDTTLVHYTDLSKDEIKIRFYSTLGDPEAEVFKEPITFPFPAGRKYKIIQGYHGSYSHSSDYSRYALDFNTNIGDTVCAAADGFVVGVIEGYKNGGDNKKWRDHSNFITLFHPALNLYTQYAHLVFKGSLVEVGDSVCAGQPIGLSGMTGFTDVAHLHFNVLKANEEGMKSTPIHFLEGYSGDELKKGVWVEK